MNTEEAQQLMEELFGDHFKREITDSKIQDVVSQNNVYLFAHEENGKVVAITTLYVVNLLSRKLGVIEEVVTLGEYRNRGIGSSLVEKAISRAKECGCDCVELTVREDKPEVQEFYKKIGFRDRKNKAFRLYL